MLKKLFIVLLFISFSKIYSQGEDTNYKNYSISEVVIYDTTLTAQQIISNAKKYFNSSPDTYSIESFTDNPIMFKVNTKQPGYLLESNKNDDAYFNYDILLYVKGDRYKIIFENLSYTNGLTYLYFGGDEPKEYDNVSVEQWHKIREEIIQRVNQKQIPWLKKALSENPFDNW